MSLSFFVWDFLSRFQVFYFLLFSDFFSTFFDSTSFLCIFSSFFCLSLDANKNVTIQLKLIKLNGKNLFNPFAYWFVKSMFNVNDDCRTNRANVQCVNHTLSISILKIHIMIECVLLHDSRYDRRRQIWSWIQIDNTGSDDIPWIHACSQCPLAYLRYDAVIGALSMPTYCISTFNYRLSKQKKKTEQYKIKTLVDSVEVLTSYGHNNFIFALDTASVTNVHILKERKKTRITGK